jgi:hypothetical protein
MAEGSTLRPATDAQTLSSDGGSSRAGSPEDQYFDESYYNELVAGADERDEKDRETLGTSLFYNYLLALNALSSCTSRT